VQSSQIASRKFVEKHINSPAAIFLSPSSPLQASVLSQHEDICRHLMSCLLVCGVHRSAIQILERFIPSEFEIGKNWVRPVSGEKVVCHGGKWRLDSIVCLYIPLKYSGLKALTTCAKRDYDQPKVPKYESSAQVGILMSLSNSGLTGFPMVMFSSLSVCILSS
jgi:hypothetical protein